MREKVGNIQKMYQGRGLGTILVYTRVEVLKKNTKVESFYKKDDLFCYGREVAVCHMTKGGYRACKMCAHVIFTTD